MLFCVDEMRNLSPNPNWLAVKQLEARLDGIYFAQTYNDEQVEAEADTVRLHIDALKANGER
jgi:hypothetical protein